MLVPAENLRSLGFEGFWAHRPDVSNNPMTTPRRKALEGLGGLDLKASHLCRGCPLLSQERAATLLLAFGVVGCGFGLWYRF